MTLAPLSLTAMSAEITMMAGVLFLVALECLKQWRCHAKKVAIGLCCVVACMVALRQNPGVHGALVHDAFTSFIQLSSLFLVGGLILWHKQRSTEWFILILSSLIGMLLMAASHDFLMLFLANELISMPLYAMMAMKRYKSQEAALKYVVLSSLTGALYLYSVSWIYGLTGSTHFGEIANAIPSMALDPKVIFALVGITTALAFKCAVAPFHIWIGDVYQGAPTPLLIILAGVPKWVRLAVWIRVVIEPFGALQSYMSSIFIGLAILSMCVGSLVALRQNHVKRFLAYSSVGHVGFALLGFVGGDALGLQASLVDMVVYVMTLTALIGVWHFLKKQSHIPPAMVSRYSFERLAYSRGSLGAAVFVVLLLSMAGLPPMPGFIAKWMMIKALIQQEYTGLALVAVVYSVVAAGYTLNVLRVMYMTPIENKALSLCLPETSSHRVFLLSVLAVLILLTFMPGYFVGYVRYAVDSLVMPVNDVSHLQIV